jgi:DNA/RNA endonuclease G (NUC1)
MMRYRRLLLPCVLLLAGAPLAAQTPTLAQRVAQLEQQVQQLRQLHGLDSVQVAALDTTTPTELRGNANVRWGYPGGHGTILVKTHFVILHDNRNKLPVWVTYYLTREDLQGTQGRTQDFRPDPVLPAGQRSELVDYSHSGYDRGHMAPAADFTRDQAAMSETFLLSNMAPQRPNLNRRIWEQLESQVRALVQNRCNIWIVTGALYLDSLQHPTQPTSFIGPDSVAVPTHFYKVILCEHPDGVHEMFAFIMPNSLDPIHQLTGCSVRKTLIDNYLRLQYSRQIVLFRAVFG